MTPVFPLTQTAFGDYQRYLSLLAGNTAYEPPALSDYDLLETEILTSTVYEFIFDGLNTAYSADYQHLQIRATIGRPGNSDAATGFIQVQSGQDMGYSHRLNGNGSSVTSAANADGRFLYGGNGESYQFTGLILDALDAFETTKNPTFRIFAGIAGNTEPFVQLRSMYRNNTFAVDDIEFNSAAGFSAGSRFSLYGLKGA